MKTRILFVLSTLFLFVTPFVSASDGGVKRECLKDDLAETRAFSPAVITEGGRIARPDIMLEIKATAVLY